MSMEPVTRQENCPLTRCVSVSDGKRVTFRLHAARYRTLMGAIELPEVELVNRQGRQQNSSLVSRLTILVIHPHQLMSIMEQGALE